MSKNIDILPKVSRKKMLQSRNKVRATCNVHSLLHYKLENERKRIARELHDILGQELLCVNMDLLSLKEKIPQKYYPIHNKIQKLSNRINESIDSMQKLITELRPGLIDKLGLKAAMEWYIEEFQRRTKIDCTLNFKGKFITLNKEQEISVYRIFEEALRNIMCHAKASKISVCVDVKKDNNFVMTIKDNGMGIDKSQIDDSESFGIIGMRERAFSLGGFLRISGNGNIGTKVELILPPNVITNKTKKSKQKRVKK